MRRTRAVRIFSSTEAACLRLVTAIAVEALEEWVMGICYLDMEKLRGNRAGQPRSTQGRAGAQTIEGNGCELLFLTPYSPDPSAHCLLSGSGNQPSQRDGPFTLRSSTQSRGGSSFPSRLTPDASTAHAPLKLLHRLLPESTSHPHTDLQKYDPVGSVSSLRLLGHALRILSAPILFDSRLGVLPPNHSPCHLP